ncbi:hypothetical protein GC175_02440 [bacterium]|nr:hypothetical protein [bacterium]
MSTPPLFWEAISFSVIAVGSVLVVAWWLYLSPMKPTTKTVQTASPRLARTLALLVGVGTFLLTVGSYWDASEHVVTGIVPGGEDFLWPPHLMMYGGFLVSFIVAIAGLVALARPNLRAGVRDPRHWVRHNPYVGALALAAGYGLFSIPGDAVWHELYGLDLTAWSPPHVLIAMAAISTPMCAAGLLIQSQKGSANPARWIGFITLIYLTLAMSEAFLIGVLEWEFGRAGGLVAARPVWLYPLIIGAVGYMAIVFARGLTRTPWTATTLALLYFGWRVGMASFTMGMSGTAPRLTLVFVLGAVLYDLVAQRKDLSGLRRVVAETAAYTIGYVLVALPTLEFVIKSSLPRFTLSDHIMTVLMTFAVGVVVHLFAERAAAWFRGDSTQEKKLDAMRVAAA